MGNSWIITLVVLIVVVLILWYIYDGLGSSIVKIITTTTIKTGSSTSSIAGAPPTTIPQGGTTSINNSFTTTATVQRSTTTLGPLPDYVPNGNFAEGYSDWNVTGNGFGAGPLNLTLANENLCYTSAKWSNYNANEPFVATTFHCGTSTTPGNLTSSPFLVDKSFLNFKIVSPEDQNMYVEILYNGSPYIITHYDTFNFSQNASSTFQNASIVMSKLLGKAVQIKIVSSTFYRLRIIAITDFQMSSAQAAGYQPGIVINQTEK